MKKVQELCDAPKTNILSPALRPDEIEELVTRLATLISVLKSSAKEKTVVSKTVDENRGALKMYTSEENKTKHVVSAARMKKNLTESKAALKDCNDRLTKVYNALQDAVASSTGIKYRKEYKEASKLLQDAKQYLRLAISSSESRPSNVKKISSSRENSMLSVEPEKICERVVGLKDCVEESEEVQQCVPVEPEVVNEAANCGPEGATHKSAEPAQVDEAVGLLEKECSDRETEGTVGQTD